MKGRPNIHQDIDLVIKAQEVFWKKGYNATSLSDLSNATGAGAGSLYNTFKGGKKELFKKSLQQRWIDLKTFREAAQKSENPLMLIKEFFLNVAEATILEHKKGCIIANTISEMSFNDEDLEEEAIKILIEVEAFYTLAISDAQKKSLLKNQTDAGILAKYLINLWCGLNTLRRIYPDKKILKQQIEFQLAVIS